MYGLVNRAIEEMVIKNHGKDVWEQIKKESGIKLEAFQSMEAYDDSITYSLVGSSSKILNLSPEVILESFGEYWVLYTGKSGYGDYFDMAGRNFPEFLENLDNLHSRVTLLMPELKMPHFESIIESDTKIRIRYQSERAGLAPMVKGLLVGLAKHFKINASVQQLSSKNDTNDYDEFMISYL